MEYIGFLIIVFLFLLIFFISGMVNERKECKRYRNKLEKEYGCENKREYKPEEFAHVDAYAKHHKKETSLDDITWNDLNMDAVYKQMNYSKTSAGDEYLYFILRNSVTDVHDFTDFEEKTEYYRMHQKERLQLQLILHKMGYTGKYSIYDYLDNLDTLGKRNSFKDICGIVALAAAVLYTFFNIGQGLLFLFAVLLYNLVTYFKVKSEIEPYICSFQYLFRILHEIEEIGRCRHDIIKEETDCLAKLYHKFDRFTRFSYLLMSPHRMNGDLFEIGLDYIRMFLHLDIIKFNSMLEEVYKHREDVDSMLTIIGKLDMYLSIGEYREYLGEYCLPEYEKGSFRAKAIYHPLLKSPVKNDIDVKRSILITGSDASGKSTFLKTIAVNAILSQSIHTVCADMYTADRFRVYSSITLKDNIFEGDSYYMAEIKSIKRILDAAEDGKTPILAFVDEVLRGTNTTERIAASGIILQKLSQCEGFCFAATHDLELTEILKHYYDNMHFEETLKDGDITFPYRLMPGSATTRNAIALLKIIGYDNSITHKAQGQAERFEITRKWEVLP
ncbi:MAG: hypothetical protein KIG50_07025 [Lachnospiraceae bacterium]|nr:hypothetical protein [Lachnospiraceae bacterium]